MSGECCLQFASAVIAKKRADKITTLAKLSTPTTSAVSSPSLSVSLPSHFLQTKRTTSGGERVPVWLMRQAGRYMADFRKYSDKIPFRERSETPEIALELSLQPWRAFRPDGVIMFSDILTPLPALGVEFDVVKGRGPVISSPLRSLEQVAALRTLDDPASSLPFVAPVLQALRSEVGNASTVLGFVGTPWTLAAYAVEGKADKHCMETKKMMRRDPELLHSILEKLSEAMAVYVVHQIDSGAQVVQLFDSWAHHLSPGQYAEFSMPYSEKVIAAVKRARPDAPLILHANGGTGKLDQLCKTGADVVGLDWSTSMRAARAEAGDGATLAGNVDPMELFGGEAAIARAVERCLIESDNSGSARGRHILNVGHGVAQGTPEEAVGIFCELARRSAATLAEKSKAAAVAA